ncbi:hypothetical protein ABIA26_002460 [Sinorhizobium fredii]
MFRVKPLQGKQPGVASSRYAQQGLGLSIVMHYLPRRLLVFLQGFCAGSSQRSSYLISFTRCVGGHLDQEPSFRAVLASRRAGKAASPCRHRCSLALRHSRLARGPARSQRLVLGCRHRGHPCEPPYRDRDQSRKEGIRAGSHRSARDGRRPCSRRIPDRQHRRTDVHGWTSARGFRSEARTPRTYGATQSGYPAPPLAMWMGSCRRLPSKS